MSFRSYAQIRMYLQGIQASLSNLDFRTESSGMLPPHLCSRESMALRFRLQHMIAPPVICQRIQGAAGESTPGLKIKAADLAVADAEGGVFFVAHAGKIAVHRPGNAVMRHQQTDLLRPGFQLVQ